METKVLLIPFALAVTAPVLGCNHDTATAEAAQPQDLAEPAKDLAVVDMTNCGDAGCPDFYHVAS